MLFCAQAKFNDQACVLKAFEFHGDKDRVLFMNEVKKLRSLQVRDNVFDVQFCCSIRTNTHCSSNEASMCCQVASRIREQVTRLHRAATVRTRSHSMVREQREIHVSQLSCAFVCVRWNKRMTTNCSQ